MYQPGGARFGLTGTATWMAAAVSAGDREVDQSLLAVEGVGGDAVADEGDRRDGGRLGGVDGDCLAVGGLGRCRGDRRAGAFEQVGRAEHLQPHLLLLVRGYPGDLGSALGVSAGGDDAAVGQQHGGGVVQPGHGRGGGEGPVVGGGVVDLAFQPGEGLVLLLQGTAAHEDRAVGQQHGVEVEPWQAHGRGGEVVGVGLGQVGDADRSGGVGLVLFADRAAADHHDALVLGRRQQHAGRLVAEVWFEQVGDRIGGDRCLGQGRRCRAGRPGGRPSGRRRRRSVRRPTGTGGHTAATRQSRRRTPCAVQASVSAE